ncbi:MAG: hypothetical protein ACJAYU_002885 [Bradymonadia bacterium]|jgi:hypothetical protein
MRTILAVALRLSVLTAFLSLGGCYTVAVEYFPMHALTDQAPPTVRLEIVDSRPEDQGRGDGRMIGQYRGSFGIPNRVENGEGGVMPSTVSAATADALAGAGVLVTADAPIVLRATVLQFWSDGMVRVGSWVEVRYELVESGWETTVEGTSSEGSFFGSPVKAVETAIEEALVDLAIQSTEVFSTQEFQDSVR